MISKEDGELAAACDDCGDQEFAGTLEFREFIDYLKGQRWRIHKDGDQWIHTCPTCSEGT